MSGVDQAQERGGALRRRVPHIDAMRAAAVMIVVLMHSGLTFVPGDGGVVVFFVISGYIITTVLLREREREGGFDLQRFYRRRLLKLGPPFLVLVAAPTLVFAVLGGDVSPLAFLSQVAFSYNWVEVLDPGLSTRVLPGSEVVWSLAIEEQFYLAFAVVWVVLVRRRAWRAATLGVTAVVAIASFVTRTVLARSDETALGDSSSSLYNHLVHGTDTRIEAIAVGVLLALLLQGAWESRAWLRPLAGWPLLLGAVVGFPLASLVFRGDWTEYALRPTAQALCAAVVLAYGLGQGTGRVRRAFERVAGGRVVNAVGLASYSIYLVHFPVSRLTSSLVDDPHGAAALALVGVNVVLGVVLGCAAYRLVEVPVLTLRERRGW